MGVPESLTRCLDRGARVIWTQWIHWKEDVDGWEIGVVLGRVNNRDEGIEVFPACNLSTFVRRHDAFWPRLAIEEFK